MRKIKFISIVICLLGVLIIVNSANAELFNRGTDILGNQLIYDSDLNITWYDYSNAPDTWQNQLDWADALSVTFEGNDYNNWRLPIALNQDGSGPCLSYNCSNSEIYYLLNTSLGNTGDAFVSFRGDFRNLDGSYWLDTEFYDFPEFAWYYSTSGNGHSYNGKTASYAAIAIHSGDVNVVPEPLSSILFLTGGVTLGFRRFRKKFFI